MSRENAEDAPHEVDYGPVRVLFGQKKGSYPEGNTLWIRGERESVLMDPAVGLHDRRTRPAPVARAVAASGPSSGGKSSRISSRLEPVSVF